MWHQGVRSSWSRCRAAMAEASPKALRTAWWMVRITVLVSFVMFLLRFVGLLQWVGVAVAPICRWFGLPGEAALALISGYFINVYSCVAVVMTLHLGWRAVTIIGAMTLAAHAMPVESAIQCKVGSKLPTVVVVRTLGSFVLGVVLNALLPGEAQSIVSSVPSLSEVPVVALQGNFWVELRLWVEQLLPLVLKMVFIIYVLNIVQAALRELGVLALLSRMVGGVMRIFGLPRRLSFLWIIANVLGLSYGASIVMDEVESGRISKRDVNLLNMHIGISHSNVEDLALVTMVGASWWIVLCSRWLMSMVVVWCYRCVEQLLRRG